MKNVRVPFSSSPAGVIVQELHAVLDGELSRLPDCYREPVLLCYLEGKSIDQAARQLVCPPGTIKIKQERAGDSKRELLHVSPVVPAPPRAPLDVMPVYLHDQYGPGQHAKAVWIHSKHYAEDGISYHEEKPLCGKQYGVGTVVAEVKDVEFPKLLDPVDDLPPTTVITHIQKLADGKVAVRGTTADNGTVQRVVVKSQEAKATAANFAEWKILLGGLPATGKVEAHAQDQAGNAEKRPHVCFDRRDR